LAVARFALDYVRVPRGHGVRKPLRLRRWQRDLIAATWDQRPQPRLAGWMLPRGQGKTSLTAVLALYELLAGADGAQVVVVATDERQASRRSGSPSAWWNSTRSWSSGCSCTTTT
jgi:phage terminase large subunit-like protein